MAYMISPASGADADLFSNMVYVLPPPTSNSATESAAKLESQGTTSDVVPCDSNSPDCCWLIRSWQRMGQTTTASSTSATACCYTIGSTTQSSGIPGVTCDSNGKVTDIDWENKGLSQAIPSGIGNLVNLQLLDLSSNQLNGPIPPEIGNLVNLQWLHLQNNQLSGKIPAKIGDLPHLKGFSFYNNEGLNGDFEHHCGMNTLTLFQQMVDGMPHSHIISGTSVTATKRLCE